MLNFIHKLCRYTKKWIKKRIPIIQKQCIKAFLLNENNGKVGKIFNFSHKQYPNEKRNLVDLFNTQKYAYNFSYKVK